MKKTIILSIILGSIFCNHLSAQLDDILGKNVEISTELLEDKNITTSITDAYTVFPFGSGIMKMTPVTATEYSDNIMPGYWKFTVQSYCLKAGTYGPYSGSGYLLSPIKGKRKDIVMSVLKKSSLHPEIDQKYIQVLLWAIHYGTKFTDIKQDVQFRVKPLLTEAEILDLSIGIRDVPLDLLPSEIKQSAKFYKELRAKISDPNTAYSELEQMAVKNGVPPLGPGSIEVKEGNWFAVGNDMYLRGFHGPYYKTVVEVYRPNPVAITYDEKSRITSVDNGVTKAEFVYNDDPGQDKINFEGKDYQIWRFKSMKFIFSPGEEKVYENSAWMIPPSGKRRNKKGGSRTTYKESGDPLKGEYQDRINLREETMEITEEYITNKFKDMITETAIEKLLDQTNYSNLENKWDIIEALKAAFSQDPNVKGEWITKNEMMTLDMWMQSINAITFNDRDPDDRNSDNGRRLQTFDEDRFSRIQAEKEAKKLKYINFLDVPGNTYGQRIGISLREFKE